MKRPFGLALCGAMLCILCACTTSVPEADALRAPYGGGTFTGTCALRSTGGGTLDEFTLSVTHVPGETAFAVTEPERHRGITARYSEGDAALTFDGVELVMPGGDACPSVFSLIHGMLEHLPDAPLTAVGETEREGRPCLALRYDVLTDGDVLSFRLWLDRESGLPCYGEATADGACLCCDWTDCELS